MLTSSAGNRRLIAAVLVLELLLVLAAVGAVLYRRLGKDGIRQKISGLSGRISLKKKKNGGADAEPPADDDFEETEDPPYGITAEAEGDPAEPTDEPSDDPIPAEESDAIPAEESDAIPEPTAEAVEPSAAEIDHASFMRPQE